MQQRIENYWQKFNTYRKEKIANRNFLIIASIFTGVTGGIAAAVLKKFTHSIASALQNDLSHYYKYYFYLFFPLLGIFLTVIYIRTFIKRSSFETGLTPILYAISRKNSQIPFHNIYSHIISSALTVGFGGSTGLEAPIVTSGSAIGSNIGRFFALSYRETTVLLACGAAAGIAGIFNSPIAGIIFAIEVLLPEFSIPIFIPLLISAATASVVARILYSEQLFYLVTGGWQTSAIVFYVLMAVIIGFFSIYFTKATYFIKGAFKKIKNPYQKVLVGGLFLGVVIFIFPALYGEGYIVIQKLLYGNYTNIIQNSIFASDSTNVNMMLLFAFCTVFAKSIATLVTISAGGNGGVFGPSLVMGGLIGFIFSYGINQTGLIQLNVPNFIVAGMAASLSGIMHAPLTGIFLIAEITGGYVLMVPLMLVSAISYFINRASQRYSIYTKILADKGDLISHEDKDRMIVNMLKLKYLINKDYTVLNVENSLLSYRDVILKSQKNIFAVVNKDEKFIGIVNMNVALSTLTGASMNDKITIKEIAEKPPDIIYTDTDMFTVMDKFDTEDIWVLPVLDREKKIVGFVSKTTILEKYRTLLKRQYHYFD